MRARIENGKNVGASLPRFGVGSNRRCFDQCNGRLTMMLYRDSIRKQARRREDNSNGRGDGPIEEHGNAVSPARLVKYSRVLS